MLKNGYLTPAQRAAAKFPTPIPLRESKQAGALNPFLKKQVKAELAAQGIDEKQYYSGGFQVFTTIDSQAQQAAEKAVAEGMADQTDDRILSSLVAVDPKTGGVLAYYGGPKATGASAIDYAQAQRQPGSSMKPYTLATGLEQGISVNAIRNGANSVKFPDGQTIRNAGSEACSACTLKQAITESLNTVFYGEALEVGPTKVRQTALAATGLPDTWWYGGTLKGKKTLVDPASQGVGAAIGIGQYEMRPIDQAVGYATLAAGGVHRAPYFVAKVTDSQGKVLLSNTGSAGNQVIPPDVANDVSYALTGVAAFSHDSLAGGRPSASKTGTQNKAKTENDNTDAWMVGYTPSIATAVWYGSDGQKAIETSAGRPIYGAGLPGQTWKAFMDAVLKGTPVEKLPTSAVITGDSGTPVIPVPTAAPTTAAPTTAQQPPATTSAAPRTTAAPTTSAAPDTTQPPTDTETASPTGQQGGIPLPTRAGGDRGGGGPGGYPVP
jgi:membrane peptidoglycan carboxypeptidase